MDWPPFLPPFSEVAIFRGSRTVKCVKITLSMDKLKEIIYKNKGC